MDYAEKVGAMLKENNVRASVVTKPAPNNKAKEIRIYDAAPDIREHFIFLEPSNAPSTTSSSCRTCIRSNYPVITSTTMRRIALLLRLTNYSKRHIPLKWGKGRFERGFVHFFAYFWYNKSGHRTPPFFFWCYSLTEQPIFTS